MYSTTFLKHLQDEKLKTQDARAALIKQKLVFATGVLGLGALDFDSLEFAPLLLFVPFFALAFDLYILAEDYSVKRIGAFLSSASTDPLERHWETWVSQNRDPFAPLSMPILTTLLAAAAMLLLASSRSLAEYSWLPGVAIGGCWVLFCYYRIIKRRAIVRAQDVCAPNQVQGIRSTVRKERYVLTRHAYDEVKFLFISSMTPGKRDWLEDLAPEYGKEEYLQVVDHNGKTIPTQSMVEDFRQTVERHPDFAKWFTVQQEQDTNDSSKATLLAARWLCHLVGFRHQCVHLFLRLAGANDEMLVQIRGIEKSESPGCLDLPVGGHVQGGHTPKEALEEEAFEELGIERQVSREFEEIGGYDFVESDPTSTMNNIEFRHIFSSALSKDNLAKIRPLTSEVAGTALFPQSTIKSFIQRFPDRVASGLRCSFPEFEKLDRKKQACSKIVATDVLPV